MNTAALKGHTVYVVVESTDDNGVIGVSVFSHPIESAEYFQRCALENCDEDSSTVEDTNKYTTRDGDTLHYSYAGYNIRMKRETIE